MIENRYIFFVGNKESFFGAYDYLPLQLSNASIIYNRYEINVKLFEILNRIHVSYKLNAKNPLPFRWIWSKFDKLREFKVNDILIFTDASIQKMVSADIIRLKKQGCKLVLILLNPLSRKSTKYAMKMHQKHRFDFVFTIDKDDAQNNGFIYTNCVYYYDNRQHEKDACNIVYDLMFVGRAKDRTNLLHSIYERFVDKILCFYIFDVDKEKQKYNDIHYNRYLKYSEIIKYVKQSNCILDVVQTGQKGLTYRFYEAVCHNRKLLTNNECVLNEPFYNSKYVCYFTDIDSIDKSFVTDRVNVDYQYLNQYSPENIVRQIEDRLL